METPKKQSLNEQKIEVLITFKRGQNGPFKVALGLYLTEIENLGIEEYISNLRTLVQELAKLRAVKVQKHVPTPDFYDDTLIKLNEKLCSAINDFNLARQVCGRGLGEPAERPIVRQKVLEVIGLDKTVSGMGPIKRN